MPWVRFEAEDCFPVGQASNMGPSFEVGTFAAESSGRRCTRLSGAGDGVGFTNPGGFNAMVVRYSIPDAPDGTGTDDELSVQVDYRTAAVMGSNGVTNRPPEARTRNYRIPLTSRFSWQYGAEHVGKGEFNHTPPSPGYLGPLVRKRFDEARLLLPEYIPGNAVVRLTKPETSKGEWIVLDLVELEGVPGPLRKPVGYLTFGEGPFKVATNGDPWSTLTNCIEEARRTNTGVYIPRGTWLLSNTVKVSGVSVQGAGMWHTTLLFTSPDKAGFVGTGPNVTVADLAITGSTRTRNGTRGFAGYFGTNSWFKSVWVERVTVGAWIANYNGPDQADGLVISNCRIRNTFADGINFAKGTRNSVAYNCHLRGTMDDSLATWSSDLEKAPATESNGFYRNTIENTLRAGGIGIFGGRAHEVRDNYVADTLVEAGIRFSTAFPGHPFGSNAMTEISGNYLVRCGGASYGVAKGGIHLEGSVKMGDIRNLRFTENTVLDSPYDGISLRARGTTNKIVVISNIDFLANRVTGAGGYGFYTEEGTTGWVRMKMNVFSENGWADFGNRGSVEIRSNTLVGF